MSGCERRPKFTMNIFNRKYASLNENVRNEVKEKNIDVGHNGRMPLSGYRKKTNCNNCGGNEKIIKNATECYDTKIKSYLNKNGKPQYNFIFNHNSYLHSRHKLFNLNTRNNIINSDAPINGTKHDYSGNYYGDGDIKCNKITYKFGNPHNQSYKATSQRERIARLKFNNTTARKINFYHQKNPSQCKNRTYCYEDGYKNPLKIVYPCNKIKTKNKESCD